MRPERRSAKEIAIPAADRSRASRASRDGKDERRFHTTLQGVVRALLLAGYPSVRLAAGRMQIPVRTLQRRLKEEGITYRELVEEFRFREACRRLNDTDDRVATIAAALGYKDPSHFSRAFRRWSGVRPSEYRRQRG